MLSMSVDHTSIENAFQNSIPIGICIFQGELRQVQHSYAEFGICSTVLGSHNDLMDAYSGY